MKRKMKWSVSILSGICVVLLVSPACSAGLSSLSLNKKNTQTKETTQSRYWALLFAVGVYENAPDQDRPEMLQACDDLYNVLIDSPQFWQPSNIHTVKGSQAILQNLIRELLWLRKNSNSEDYVLVYLTTHGSQLRDKYGQPLDLPPKDEADGSDEFLVMYNGFNTWYGIIWDDMLNFFLSMIKCRGLCLIVDSCYSGGFNDSPYNDINPGQFSAQSFTNGFVQDVAATNRIVLMSCEENTVSFGTFFSNFLVEGFSGWADFNGNNDGINSAEEAFSYALPRTEFWVWFNTGYEQHPTINDMYPGEFPITI
jgi:hypothetical protein